MRQKLTADKSVQKSDRGRLRIGDDWNAITIIALSQTNPLKAIAEFVENSIDAQARHITIIRGKERGEHYLKISDDGNGLPCAEDGRPDFKYVATHICDSLKRRLKREGAKNIQGEFGIGLLSFWTVGHRLSMVSSGRDNRTYQMSMEKDKSGYRIAPRPHLLPIKGAQLTISPLLAGIRLLNGERIQRYLASELRDRIRHTAAKFCDLLEPLKDCLMKIALEQSKAEEEHTSKNILRSVQKALREAMLILPQEEYDWFDIGQKKTVSSDGGNGAVNKSGVTIISGTASEKGNRQREFFEVAGPLFSARIQPGSAIVQVGRTKSFRAVGLDRSKRQVEENLSYQWHIVSGNGVLDRQDGEIVVFNASGEAGLTKLKLVIRQSNISCEAEGIITIVDSVFRVPVENGEFSRKGLPDYTIESAAGQTWRSRYDQTRNIVVVNSGHRDFVYASRERARKLRYICRLFAKELILHNFVGIAAEELLEHLIELSLYTEETLR